MSFHFRRKSKSQTFNLDKFKFKNGGHKFDQVLILMSLGFVIWSKNYKLN